MRLDVASEFTQGLRRRYPVDIKRDELDRVFAGTCRLNRCPRFSEEAL